jgi:hypothetical protein
MVPISTSTICSTPTLQVRRIRRLPNLGIGLHEKQISGFDQNVQEVFNEG